MTERRFESDSDFTIEGIELQRGARVRGKLRLVELADGSPVDLQFMVVRGAEPGPVLYVGSAIHGDEIASVELVSRFARDLDAGLLRGTLLVVPVQNPMAFQVQHRFFLGHMLKSPMDQNPADPWAAFPGDPNGNTAERIAHVIFDELMSRADYMIDVHTPTTGGRYASFAFVPPTRCGAVVDEAIELAKSFGAHFVLANDKGMYVGDRNPHTVMGERGVPAVGIEIGEGGQIHEEEVVRGVRGLKNVLRKVGMLPGSVEEFGDRKVIRTMTVVRASRAGVLHRTVDLREMVEEGQVVARIANIFGDIVEEVRSPHAGPVVRVATFPTVTSGERVVQLGVPR